MQAKSICSSTQKAIAKSSVYLAILLSRANAESLKSYCIGQTSVETALSAGDRGAKRVCISGSTTVVSKTVCIVSLSHY